MESAPDLKAIRLARGWRQSEMAAYLGVDRSTVVRMEAGRPITGPVRRLLELMLESDARQAAAASSQKPAGRGRRVISRETESCAS